MTTATTATTTEPRRAGRATGDASGHRPGRATGRATVGAGTPRRGPSRPTRVATALRSRSVRTRVLAWVMALTALAMLLAGGASHVVQRQQLDARIHASLLQEVGELRSFGHDGVDPETGQGFTSVARFFQVTLQRNIPDEHEGFLTLVDGDPAFVFGGERTVPLEQYPALLAQVRDLRPGDPVTSGRVATPDGTVAYAAVPVTAADDPSTGVFLIGYNLDREAAEITAASRTFALVAAAALLLVGIVAWGVTGRLLQPLGHLRGAAHRISTVDDGLHSDERIAVRGHDDVSDLAGTFNRMLDRLQAAFGAQRQLLDDAGHELRTPITIVRGHVELMDPDDPEDVRDTQALVLDELDRMHRLVDDLVLLARARRPDFLRRDVVEACALVERVLDKARALGDRRWQVDARGGTAVAGDPQRLTQALLQLAANAVRATAPGQVVALGSAAAGGEVRLWVRDEGHGVAEEDRQRIFERFARGGEATRDDGSGLGLAIVSAIAAAHGGRVELDSAPGRGATFTVVLPAADGGPAELPTDGAAVPLPAPPPARVPATATGTATATAPGTAPGPAPGSVDAGGWRGTA